VTEGRRDKSLHRLSGKQLQALSVLHEGGTQEEAATASGVHRVTVTRWVNHHPAFIAELNRLEHEALTACYQGLLRTTRSAINVAARALEGDDGDFALRWLRVALPSIARNAHLTQDHPRSSTSVVEDHRRSMRSALDEGLSLGVERSTGEAEAEIIDLTKASESDPFEESQP
jgi:hypothetical protein